MLIIAAFYAVKYFVKDDDGVPFELLSEEQIPQKIQEILPRYKSLERALACKVDGEIFVIATRGEKPTGGYTIQIDSIEKVNIDGKTKLVVYTTFKDPKPGDIVTQVITYPYVVVKTELEELPDKIELKVKYDD
ncbi:protease complex subunit PrcB family protein [Crassaminicella indica]|uniref:Protease complex subunit PrcB family protein n=2 Tax=Crassaminicella indica TaxID=2855394 RepID=A0ABX8REA5_9CLOT|nr:protease complex subunit PrcB family protein [Crassaminicella indica]